MIDATHDPDLSSWVEGAGEHPDFPIQNLPLGVFSFSGEKPRIGCAIGDFIFNLAAAGETGLLPATLAELCRAPALGALLEAGPLPRRKLRARLSELLSDPAHRDAAAPLLHPAMNCTMHLPAHIGDYTDFYVGIHHATNIGRQFRPDNPLLPNYKYVPIGYHGRASSIRIGGEPVIRPNGQRKSPEDEVPEFGPAGRLDYELEIGIWIGPGNRLGEPIPIGEAAKHIAGFCLLNDWSARDLQAWEYQPLGPFLAKNFASTISPWVVTLEALAPFRTGFSHPASDPQPLPYLSHPSVSDSGAFDVKLDVLLATEKSRQAGAEPAHLSSSNFKDAYWTVAQLITHHTVNGCNLQPGDLLGTGTLSGPNAGEEGSLLEVTAGGKNPVKLPWGEERTFLQDNDEVILRARCSKPGYPTLRFGESVGRVLPART